MKQTVRAAFVLLLGAGVASVGLALSHPAAARRRAPVPAAAAPCLNARTPGLREFHPAIARVPNSAPGKVLPGRRLRDQYARTPHFRYPDPLESHYPGGRLPSGPVRWRNLAGVPRSHLVFEHQASEVFNAPGDRYRIAFNQSYYGVQPTNIGDFNGDGVDDIAIPDHYAYVDGKPVAGEVDIYLGRRGHHIDPRHDIPDVIIYGDQAGAKLGISVARAGDVNGDGYDDLLVAAAFYTNRGPHGRPIVYGGRAYLIYGGSLNRYRCPVKIRATDIGRRIPGIVFDGGFDGTQYLGWASEFDSGDFNGDGYSDLVLGAYDPYPGRRPTFGAHAYVIYGSRHLPRRFVGYRLGVDTNRGGIRSTVYTLPDGSSTRDSLGFSASFVGDLTGNGHDDLAFAAGLAGANHHGEDYVFFGPPARGVTTVPMQSAPLTIYADSLSSPPLIFNGLEGMRPNGDIYGDGHQDALVSARFTEIPAPGGGWEPAGAVGVLRGRPHFPARLGFSQLDTIIYGDQHGEVGGVSMATGADFNGDGCTDILVNDPNYLEQVGSSLQDRGRFWLFLGSPHLPRLIDVEHGADRIILADSRLPGELGFNWTIGDFNADGRPDLLAADEYEGDRRRQDFVGRTDLFYNSALHLPWGPRDGCRP